MVKTIYDNPKYWCGDLGYRPPGYSDFAVNWIKEGCIMFRKPGNVLDVGCAYGFTVRRLNRLDYNIVGLDISSYAISKAPREVKHLLCCAPAWDTGFGAKSIDLVFSSGMLEHIPKDKLDKTIKELTRIGNRGLIGVACKDDPTTEKDEDASHQLILTRAEWQEMFPSEFKIISDSTKSWFQELHSSFAALFGVKI